ncbi:hypothetical protein [Nocardioides sp.]|uniref:hypothetical protein n=1 Tax=Nocardioides sp. TaxID=35761 RepID=UPI0037842CBC
MHLTPTPELAAEVDALATRYGGRVGLDAVAGDLDRRLRRTVAPCRTPHRAWTWDRADRRDRRWWPQGVSVEGRHAVVSWYSDTGSRVSLLDLPARRYQHVELVRPTADGHEPLRVHAGGLGWHGHRLFVAATRAGVWVCDTRDVVRGPDGYVLPVRLLLEPSEPFRFSFVAHVGEELVVGEYDNAGGTRRLGRVAAEGGPVDVLDGGVRRAQGAVRVGERWYVTASHGPRRPGSVWSGPAGRLREHRWAVPMGPEDLAYDAERDLLWTVTEHPRRRWVVAVRRSRLG